MSGDYSRFTFKPRKRFSGVLMQQGRVQLDADWNEEIDLLKRRWEIQATDTFGHAAVPKKTTPDGFKVLTPNPLTIGEGRMYVDGLLAERFDKDPHHSNLPLSSPIPVLTTGQGAIVYLDIWEREVTYIEDPDLLEPALGGPDTATRTQVVWQVRVQGTTSPRCGFNLDFPPSAGRLTSRAVAPPASDDPCVLPPTGNYRGLENRLYRVEVHAGGTLGNATYKWSRENASIVSRVTKIAGKTITVNRIGRDKVLRFQPGDWVEITDDVLELQGAPGQMAKVVVPDEATLTLELDRTLPAIFNPSDLQRHTRVRRWDQRKDENGNPLPDGGAGTLKTKTASGPVVLEDGVQIEINADPATGQLKTGDYWVFAARAVDGSVEELTQAPPRGIHHHYAQLASWDGDKLHDCRRLWPDGCCCCTVEVGDGINSHGDFNTIAEAYAAVASEVPEDVPIRICLLPGVHRPKDTLIVERSWVTISGCGLESQVVAPRGQSIFEMLGVSTNLENVRLTSEPDDLQRPALLALYSYGSRIENNLFESVGGPLLLCQAGRTWILRNTFVGNQALQTNGWDLVIAWNELFGTSWGDERGALIDLWPGLYRAFILGNLLQNGSGHGIALSSSLPGQETANTLDEIVIAGNDIRSMRGSGIATRLFLDSDSSAPGVSGFPASPTGTTPVYVHRLRIENNAIAGCVAGSTWKRDDGAPQGGIVLGGIEHLEIADNQIELNGAYTTESPVAGIYLGTVRGLIVRDNVVTGNGWQIVGGEVEITEGGIVARDLGEALEVMPTSPTPGARSINRPPVPIMRPDGWPAAMVHGNLVVAPRGRALVLLGLGAMHVTDNRLVARELVARADPEAIGLVGAVLIRSGSPYYQYISLSMARWTTPVFFGEGSVTFSDNEVFLDDIAPPGSLETVVVTITAGQDLAFQDNLVRCWKGLANLELGTQFNTILWGTNVRASGNGIHEEPFDGFFWSLYVFASLLSAVTGNQVTHCLFAPGPDQQHALGNNAEQLCNRGTFDRKPAARSETASRVMLERMASSARAEAAALRTQPPQPPATAQLRRARPVESFETKALAAESLAERLEYGLRLADRTKEIQPNDWSLLGRVLDAEGKPVAGARLEISEGGKKLAEIPADDQGEFFAHYSGQKFKDLFARAPQLTLTIKSAKGKVLQTLERPLVPKSDQLEALELRIGEPAAPPPPQPGGAPAPEAEEKKQKEEAKPRKAKPKAQTGRRK